MKSVNEIRAVFLDYFRRQGHEIVPSAPLVPRNDPSLMFTNAGMVPFKNVFTGLEKRPYRRATSAQKCVRAGGKHNDLDNVGYTARHHTFFEMLGNFSFGDYFKEEAIYHAWNVLTKEFELKPEKLLVTIYHTDDEAAAFWKKIAGLPDNKIIRIATADNFWAMGDTGPCGPCSEIFYDHGDKIFGGPPGSADEDGDRFIEIWNLVFMQYEQVAPGERRDLPHPSIDTGMGLERIAAVLQNVHDNYDIDLFRALIHASEQATGVKAVGEWQASHRVIADHLRSSAFLIADGVLPANEGRGYVLRRIMRRAMRHAQLLGAKEPLLWRLLPVLVQEMGQAYPELIRAQALIAETLQLEEKRFRKTLERGLSLLDDESAGLAAGDSLAGDIAFRLYDTYGFPPDLTQDALRRRNIGVDMAGFDKAMARQKAEARRHWAGSGEAATEAVWFGLRDKLGAVEFLGYDTDKAEATITALLRNGEEVASVKAGQAAAVLCNQTPFYAESGGQIGDTGTISGKNFLFKVENTRKKADGLIVHFGTVAKGTIKTGDTAELAIDAPRRLAVRRNHSATHLLHEALRRVLGNHVAQKGSLVSDERLRFDFSHPKPLTKQEITEIEVLANSFILQNTPVQTRIMALDEARALGARALFGEKYGDEVRVVSMGLAEAGGLPETGSKPAPAWSIELCGGTHVRQTGDIGLLHIITEGAVAAGQRRIEALTGAAARRYLAGQDEIAQAAAAALKTAPRNVAERLAVVLEERRKLEKDLQEARKKLALGGVGDNAEKVEMINGLPFMAKIVAGMGSRELKSLADQAKSQIKSGIVVFIGLAEDKKAVLTIGVTQDKTKLVSAVDLVRIGAAALGGTGGGGRVDMAQAGGSQGDKAEQAIAAIRRKLASL
ncbi:MAG: alanine--tRNA ligase [Candidatus Tokpelaia sp.]|nr:MAG: alanine--tRNA ligase [Candidatus Tokpelaia sp.]KAA6207687.1 MAG: alanine--tRNA ligase [Candidatus Tokpelaia sp.]